MQLFHFDFFLQEEEKDIENRESKAFTYFPNIEGANVVDAFLQAYATTS